MFILSSLKRWEFIWLSMGNIHRTLESDIHFFGNLLRKQWDITPLKVSRLTQLLLPRSTDFLTFHTNWEYFLRNLIHFEWCCLIKRCRKAQHSYSMIFPGQLVVVKAKCMITFRIDLVSSLKLAVFVGVNMDYQLRKQICLESAESVADWHYSDVIISTMASQITSLAIVYSTVYSCGDQRKHQSSASLAFVRRIHRWPVNSPHRGPVTRKMFLFDDVIMIT